MSTSVNKNGLLNEAGKAGLILGGISIAYTLLQNLLALIHGGAFVGFIVGVVNFSLWLAKLVGCIWLMRFLMMKVAGKYDSLADKAGVRKFGYLTALASSLVFSAFSMAWTMMVSDTTGAVKDTLVAQYTEMGIMTDTLMETIDSTIANLPTITFTANLIYCFIFGAVVTIILSNKLFPDNPFRNE